MALLPAAPPGLSRRSFLAASAAGLALLAGCTGEPGEEQEPVTAAQVVSLAEQVAVQEALVAAYAAAGEADAGLAAELTDLAAQADEQLARLRAASPDTEDSPAAPAPTSGAEVGADPRAWLRGQVVDTAVSHAVACLEQSGARTALLGSIAAGLRGQAEVLA